MIRADMLHPVLALSQLGITAIALGAAAGSILALWIAQLRRTALEGAERRRAEDVADRFRREVAVRDAVLSGIRDGLVLVAPNDDVAYESAGAREMLGRRVTSVDDLSPPALAEAVRSARRSGTTHLDLETTGRSLSATVAPVDGHVVMVIRDVTDARRTDRVRTDFVASASHELKTPVASILALAQSLQEAIGSDPAAVKRFTDLLEEEAIRLSTVVTELLDLSRIEGKAGPRAPVHLHRIVADEIERVRTRASSIRVSVDASEPAVVDGSAEDLGLLVHNLLDNAVRYSRDGGEVRVSIEARDGRALLRVSDTGIGIAAKDLDRIFERFYRADPARSRGTGGTGLGLSIVKHVVDAHGGSVTVHSVLAAGTTFTVSLPITEAAAG